MGVIGAVVLGFLVLQVFRRRPKAYKPEQEWPGGRRAADEDRRSFLAADTPVSAYEMTWMKKNDAVREG